MSGPFYGSLAASASVFVAILTALLVNNYVRVKSDRRQTENELNRIEEELEGLRDRRDDYEETVDTLVEKREDDYREKAEEQVNEFIESEIPSEYFQPIEKLSVVELYQDLIEFHDCESSEELEHSPINLHHRDVLEERMDEIENEVLNEVVPPFASKYEGEGWDPSTDPNRTSLVERLAEMDDEEEEDDEDIGSEDSGEEDSDPDIEVKAENLGRDALDLDDFLEKYKEEYGLDELDEKTKNKLSMFYDEVVDTNPNPRPYSSSPSAASALNTGPFDSLEPGFMDAALAASQAGAFEDPLADIDIPARNKVLGLNVRQQQKLEEARENLRDVNNEIQILEQRQGRLEREKERLHPEDLKPTLYANVATIFLSVVVPIAAYLNTVTEFTVSELAWVNIWMIAGSWLLGLIVVFAAIYLRITNDE